MDWNCVNCGELVRHASDSPHVCPPGAIGRSVEDRLEDKVKALELQVDALKAQDDVRTGRWCNGNMAEGRGPCGVCPKCSKANFDRAEAAELQLKESNRLNDELKALLVYVVDKSPSVTLVWKERLAAVDVSSVEIIKEPAGTDSYFTLKLKGHVGKSCYGHAQDSCKEQQTEKRKHETKEESNG